jgi:coproporphyrinogen III oxidase-like Fe-S oxidoreductase
LFGRNILRRRSVPHFIGELKQLLSLYNIKQIFFGDDDFFIRPLKELKEFAEAYKKEINLPFAVMVSANTFQKEKMDNLINAGLKIFILGVQSASEHVLKDIFHREIPFSKTEKVVKQLDHYARNYKIEVVLDFIIDNPYETKKDIYQTFRFILNLPNYFRIEIFSLSFLPGTPIYHRAIKDGIINPINYKKSTSFKSPILFQENYITILINKFNKYRNSKYAYYIFRILGSKLFFYLGSIIPSTFYKFLLNNFGKRRKVKRLISKEILKN